MKVTNVLSFMRCTIQFVGGKNSVVVFAVVCNVFLEFCMYFYYLGVAVPMNNR